MLSSMTCNPMVPISVFRSAWKYPRKSVTFVSFPLFLSLSPLHSHKVTVHRGPKLVSVWPRRTSSAQETHKMFSRDPALKLPSSFCPLSTSALLRTFYQPWNLKRTKDVAEREEAKALTSLCEPQSYEYSVQHSQHLELRRSRNRIIVYFEISL